MSAGPALNSSHEEIADGDSAAMKRNGTFFADLVAGTVRQVDNYFAVFGVNDPALFRSVFQIEFYFAE